jgi:hypothetical protein
MPLLRQRSCLAGRQLAERAQYAVYLDLDLLCLVGSRVLLPETFADTLPINVNRERIVQDVPVRDEILLGDRVLAPDDRDLMIALVIFQNFAPFRTSYAFW